MTFTQKSVAILTLFFSSSVFSIDWQAPLLTEHPMVGQIYDLESRQPISETELLQRLQQADLIMIGEKHDNKDHHMLEARLLKALTNGPDKPAVVFEMLNRNQQPLLNGLKDSRSLASMKSDLNWNSRGWSWDDYGPLFQLTHQSQAPLIAGNISRQQVSTIYKDGANALSAPRFNTLAQISTPVREQIHDELYRNHCELMPRDRLAPMVDVQLARDASMADAMLSNRTDAGAVLIAGGFHVRKDLSVPLHLTARAPSLSQAIVLLAEVKEQQTELSSYSKDSGADYLWLTPKQNNRDYCAEMRESMQQKPAKQG